MSHPFLDYLVAKKAKTVYVILLKDDQGRVALLADPGQKLPWHGTNLNLAKFYATSCNGEAHTWQSAFDILKKDNPKFEKDLYERIAGKPKNHKNGNS